MKLSHKYSKQVTTWLLIGTIMVFFQVIIGGITRLTESGLSITKWEVVSGTLPPLSDAAWQEEFELYKQTPQYREINEGMSFSEFKFIYFWEYIHRLWARFMGFVFLIPFIYFMIKKQLDKTLLKDLGLVVVLAILAAIFGWIMVASGLINRPWVNAYKLSIHLLIAFGVFVALLWAYLNATYKLDIESKYQGRLGKWIGVLAGILFLQLFLGGVLSGMRAAVVYPTWPDMHGSYFPSVIFDLNQWNADNFNNYDSNEFMPALIHFLHRNTAYLLLIVGLWIAVRLKTIGNNLQLPSFKLGSNFLLIALLIQVTLGILTVINSVGSVPVLLGVLHQAGALFVISVLIYLFFIFKRKNI